MFDSSVYTPAEGQIFIWSTANQAMIPTNIQNGSLYQNSENSTGTDDIIVAALPITDSSNKIISGQVTLFVNSGANYEQQECATWTLDSIITAYSTGITYGVAPAEYDFQTTSSPVKPTVQYVTGAFDFEDCFLGIQCISNQLYLIITPSSTHGDRTDSYVASCSLIIDDIVSTPLT